MKFVALLSLTHGYVASLAAARYKADGIADRIICIADKNRNAEQLRRH